MFKKTLLVIVALGLIFGGWKLIGVIGKDKIQPLLDEIAKSNSLMVELSNQAASRASRFEIQVAAANIANVLTSHNRTLADYYQQRGGKQPNSKSSRTSGLLKDLSDNPSAEAYNSRYNELIQAELGANLRRFETIDQSSQAEPSLKDLARKLAVEQKQLANQLP